MAFEYIQRFKKLGFGLFCHFGLYSKLGRGEWALCVHQLDQESYNAQMKSFEIEKDWAKRLVETAKSAGCKYITLTTRHHDGFSLFDTCGLNNFDAPHSACGRDLVREFVDACNAEGIIPFFYHTLLDWYNPDYKANFLFAKSEKIGGEELYVALKENGVLVRHFTAEKIKDYNRITIGSQKEMQILVDKIKTILEAKQCELLKS